MNILPLTKRTTGAGVPGRARGLSVAPVAAARHGQPTTLRVGDIIDERPMSRLQLMTVGLCMLVAVLDGFDTQTIGFLAPAISRSLGIALTHFGPVFTAGLIGLMIGAVTLGPLADRLGRKKILVLSTFAFGACAFATAFVHTLPELLVIRFLTGIGLGGAMPNVVALASEFSPCRHARVCVTLLFCGMPAGAVSGGLVSAALLPAYGWHAVFYFGGLLPMAVALAVLVWMPESVKYLIASRAAEQRVRRTMLRIAPELATQQVRFADVERHYTGLPVRHLFTEGRASKTVLLWIPYFMNLLVLYFVISWLPAVLVLNGHPVSMGIAAITAFSVGGIVGSLAQGRLMNQYGVAPVLLAEFVLYVALVVVLALLPLSDILVIAVTLGAGAAVQGAQAGLNSLAAEIYPTSMRATGVGWALGVGRIGSVFGPVAGGLMLVHHWDAQHIFLAGVIPGLIAAAAIVFRGFGREAS
ncbi:MFS transporter [Paraburkholderia sediminicola]|uniref:MFS transporter n=1 Tax=Paraburkholderia sediminicola TaxID=458836 RepID=UPI0038BC7F9F